MRLLKKGDYYRYGIEIFSVFLGVTLAFALSEWSENRAQQKIEIQTLEALREGLILDIKDIDLNMYAHKLGMTGCDIFSDYVSGKATSSDTLAKYINILTRDFISVQNSAAYESLKSRGVDIVTDDSLRLDIIALYDTQFRSIEKLEEEYHEMQFHRNYFPEIAAILSGYIKFDENYNITAWETPITLPDANKSKLLLYFNRIKFNRNFTLNEYQSLRDEVLDIQEAIRNELEKLK